MDFGRWIENIRNKMKKRNRNDNSPNTTSV